MTLQQAQRADIIMLDEPPKGWRRLEGALTQPCGYDWYCNGKSRWSGEYKHALVAQKKRKSKEVRK